MSSESPQDNSSPSGHRLALFIGGIALGIIVALGFSLFYKSQVKVLDLVFWAIGGGLLGLSAGLPARRK